ncbi:integrase family protein [Desulfonatronospira thiodismutans ASO3-1]|uniref:Integrase family protein n=1 Tax=Desulfonatronospira thiodismutans ASO3-1 TaxID=555779 RepID=D6SLB3_9BACT|nr:integrase family protein [Desulfonatronospira thiodismutans ASO3-1]
MSTSKAVEAFMGYQRINSGEKTIKNYKILLHKFDGHLGEKEISQVTSEDIFNFLVQNTEGQKQSTKRLKFTLIKAFFNFITANVDEKLPNPCHTQVLRKSFRDPTGRQWNILEKDVVDEIIFRTDNPRNRLMLELMARGGMRIGEVLKLRADDLDDRKLFIDRPKSGRQSEVVFIPKKVAERLREYIRSNGISPAERIFPIGYTGARAIVKKSGQAVGINLCPHDLRRHAATYASRAGAPLEIVSKVILRHANLATTQRYLGKVSDTEALHWIENIYR